MSKVPIVWPVLGVDGLWLGTFVIPSKLLLIGEEVNVRAAAFASVCIADVLSRLQGVLKPGAYQEQGNSQSSKGTDECEINTARFKSSQQA